MRAFSHEISLQPRYRDLDPNGHVNHAVYATYLEEARTAYWRAAIDEPLSAAGVALVSQKLDYSAEITLEDEVTVAMRVERLGSSSIPKHYEIRTQDGVAATADATLVAFDRDDRTARPIPERWREAIIAYEERHGDPLPDSQDSS